VVWRLGNRLKTLKIKRLKCSSADSTREYPLKQGFFF
jgi:hypothetical protein